MIYKIYTLADPETNIIRYIGKTKESLNNRLSKHINDSKKANNRRCNWIKKLTKAGLKPKIEILETLENNKQCSWAEIYWISQFKTWGFDLINTTEGGEGYLGYKPTEITLKRQSERMLKWWETRKKPKKQTLSKKEQYFLLSNSLSVPINQYDLKGNKIKEWKSTNEVMRFFNIGAGSITNALKDNERVSLNSFWRYKKQENSEKITVKFKDVKSIKFSVINIENNEVFTYQGKKEIEKALNTHISTIYTSISKNRLFRKKYKISKEIYYGPHSRFMYK